MHPQMQHFMIHTMLSHTFIMYCQWELYLVFLQDSTSESLKFQDSLIVKVQVDYISELCSQELTLHSCLNISLDLQVCQGELVIIQMLLQVEILLVVSVQLSQLLLLLFLVQWFMTCQLMVEVLVLLIEASQPSSMVFILHLMKTILKLVLNEHLIVLLHTMHI